MCDAPAVDNNDTQAEQGEGWRREVVEEELTRRYEAVLAAGVVRAVCATRVFVYSRAFARARTCGTPAHRAYQSAWLWAAAARHVA